MATVEPDRPVRSKVKFFPAVYFKNSGGWRI
jgi:hypothetical protein